MNKEKCPICHKVGFHKMSCPTQKVTVFMSDVKVEGAIEDAVEGVTAESEGATKSGSSEFPNNHAIPTLEGDEAEEFIRKAEAAERGTVYWSSRQMKKMEFALNKSRIANRKLKYAKGEAPKVKRSKDVEE